jgi:S1-C subfamily serine protease
VRATAVAAALLAAAAVAAGCGGAGAPVGRAPDVVRVSLTDAPRPPEIATGFAVGDGRVVTVAHAVGGAGTLRVASVAARVLRAEPRTDLAVIAAPGVRAAPPRRGSARAGQAVTVRVLRGGRAWALRATVRRRITARVHPLGGGPPQVRPGLELAVRIEPGDSGAPVLDGDQRVVGVIFARADGRDGLAYAVDARALPGA